MNITVLEIKLNFWILNDPVLLRYM